MSKRGSWHLGERVSIPYVLESVAHCIWQTHPRNDYKPIHSNLCFCTGQYFFRCLGSERRVAFSRKNITVTINTLRDRDLQREKKVRLNSNYQWHFWVLFTFLLSVVIKVQVTIVGTEVLFQVETITYKDRITSFKFWWQLACEQALLFGRVKQVSRERASERLPRSRVLARLASLAQIGELARRLDDKRHENFRLVEQIQSWKRVLRK